MALAQEPGYLAPKVSAADRERLGLTGRDLQFVGAGNSVEWLGGSCAYRIIEPAADDRTLDCALTATRGRDRTVRVTDAGGKPLTGVIVAGVTDRSPARLAPLKEPSFTALGLDPDRPRTLLALHPGRTLGAVMTLRGDEDAPVLKLQPCASIAGRLLDADGRPLEGVEVSPVFDDRDAREFERRVRPDAWPVRTGADGRFRLAGLLPGLKVGLYLRHEGSELAANPRIGWKTPAAGEVIDVGDRTVRPE
jgi:hypothetical protein